MIWLIWYDTTWYNVIWNEIVWECDNALGSTLVRQPYSLLVTLHVLLVRCIVQCHHRIMSRVLSQFIHSSRYVALLIRPVMNIFLSSSLRWNKIPVCNLLLLGGELLAERCRTDDLMSSISLLCLPSCCVNPEILWLQVLRNRSQPSGSWTTGGSLPVRWWT